MIVIFNKNTKKYLRDYPSSEGMDDTIAKVVHTVCKNLSARNWEGTTEYIKALDSSLEVNMFSAEIASAKVFASADEAKRVIGRSPFCSANMEIHVVALTIEDRIAV